MTDLDPATAAFHEFREAWNDGKRPDPKAFCESRPGCGKSLKERIERFLYVVEGLHATRGGEDREPPPDRTLGDYRILREIGSGGMGTVYEAEQISLKRKVAVKVLPSLMSHSMEAVRKFRREAEAAGRQRHPGIVAIHAVEEHEGVHFIVQELVEGGRTLADRLAEIRNQNVQPPGYFREAAGIMMEAGSALQHAHESGVIHRDVKPSNILLTKDHRPKITDFGLAKVENALALTRTGDCSGTPYYMSPEQVTGRSGSIDHRTDIYSLGVTLYEMLTLERPFEGETAQEVLKKIALEEPPDPRTKNASVPRDLAVICLKAMEKKAGARYGTMKALVEDLGRFLSGDVILAKPAQFTQRLSKRVKRNPALSTAVAVALVAVAAWVVLGPWYSMQIAKERNRFIRLSDAKRLSQLLDEEKMLWPALPEKVKEMEAWLAKASALSARLPLHRETMKSLRQGIPAVEGRWMFESPEAQWEHDLLAELVDGLEALSFKEGGIRSQVEGRLAFARSIRFESVEKRKEEWNRALASIAAGYQGLAIQPMTGLVPLGPDPDTGLWEFAHLQSGDVPKRCPDGHLAISEDSSLVLVLIPGGSFAMGGEERAEQPVHTVHVAPFLLSKYEMTQGQWLRFTGMNPSAYGPDRELGGKRHTLLHPVENISWVESRRVVHCLGLRLPTEAEWEYATRAGTRAAWWTGNEEETLSGAANLLDLSYKAHQGAGEWACEDWLQDGYVTHAPVQTYRANPFGLHQVHGNLWEWCEDAWHADYRGAPDHGGPWLFNGPTPRVCRGGSWHYVALLCRSAYRFAYDQEYRSNDLGVRPAMSLPGPVSSNGVDENSGK